MDVKSGLPWRPQDVRDVRGMSYQQKRAAKTKWNHPKREKWLAVNKTDRSWSSEEHFELGHGYAVVAVFPAGLWSCFVPVFPHNPPFVPFGTLLYILGYFGLEVHGLLLHFDFIRITVKTLHDFQKRL
jgi:hypothetical protein